MGSVAASVVMTGFVYLLLVALSSCRAAEHLDATEYCAGRQPNEFFRKKVDLENTPDEMILSDCKTYYRCTRAGRNRFILHKMDCNQGMYFDIDFQTCRFKKHVQNCDQWQKFQKAKPKWPLRSNALSNCPNGEIECGSGECLPKSVFCDNNKDCEDGSDENICANADEDPNAADRCDTSKCIWEDGCFCSVDGTKIPGSLSSDKVPQMITITFTGAVTGEAMRIYDEIFKSNYKNKGNGCTIKGTFFISHAFSNYSAIQELHRRGHEIAVSSITNNPKKEYWSTLDRSTYVEEFDGSRLIAENFALIQEGEILGLRVPAGRVGGNQQFDMMVDYGFLYDSSIAAPRASVPLWPYTLQFRMPHKCLGTEQNCPTKNFTVWEMVMNPLDRREDAVYAEDLTGCYLVDQCNILEPDQFRSFLDLNLNHHYSTNRAPLNLHFTSSYFLTRRAFLKVFINWINEVSQRGDFYFVTMLQAISWMERPVDVAQANTFEEWKNVCVHEGFPHCTLPNPCPDRPPRELSDREDLMYLHTCRDCPPNYPWLYDPYGEASLGRAILKK